MEIDMRKLGLLLLGLAALGPARAQDENWLDDFDRAIELAKREGKDLVVDFTGSDW